MEENELMRAVEEILNGAVGDIKKDREQEFRGMLEITTQTFRSQVETDDDLRGKINFFALVEHELTDEFSAQATTVSGRNLSTAEAQAQGMTGGKFSHVGAFPEVENFIAGDQDMTIAVALYEGLQRPLAYLITYQMPENNYFSALITNGAILCQTILPTGDTAKHYFDFNSGDPSDLDKQLSGDTLRLMKALLFLHKAPVELLSTYPYIYEGIVKQTKKNMEEKFGKKEEDE